MCVQASESKQEAIAKSLMALCDEHQTDIVKTVNVTVSISLPFVILTKAEQSDRNIDQNPWYGYWCWGFEDG